MLKYGVVMDEKFKSTEQREIHVTTESKKEKDFAKITEEIIKQYKDKNLDSMHLYMHAHDGDDFGALKAHSFIAYTYKHHPYVRNVYI